VNPEPPALTPRIAVGRVTRAHGLRGEVAVEIHSEVSDRFAPGSSLQREDGSTLVVQATRPHQGRVLVTFEGVGDRSAAEALRDAWLFVPAESLPELSEGSYWPHELEGCAVVTEEGRALGTLAEVLSAPGNDVWAVDGEGGRVLVAAVRDAVVSVDLAARRVVVREGAIV
jgi:16S rRNA processing protein RimM